MRFSLNLVEIYENMANEDGEPLSNYMSYEEFVEIIKERNYTVIETVGGDFIVIRLEE